jgi:hypothetical protein
MYIITCLKKAIKFCRNEKCWELLERMLLLMKQRWAWRKVFDADN